MLWWGYIFEVFMSNSLCFEKLSLTRESQVLSTIIDLDITEPAKRFSLNQVGYNTDEEIIQLLIRTSMGVEELYNKLISLGYNSVNKDDIQVTEDGTICVPLPTEKYSEYIPIYGKFMSLA